MRKSIKYQFTIIAVLIVIVIMQIGGNKITAQQEGKLVFPWWNGGDVYTMNLDGTNETLIAADVGASETVWSPDGNKIAFVSSGDIYVMNKDGTDLVALTNSNDLNVAIAWSPDGSQLAFASKRSEDDYDLYVMNSDGSNPVKLTNQIGHDDYPTWSPDGNKIAFASNRDGEGFEIYVMNSDGSDVVQLTNGLGQNYFPSWSPDGNKVAFARQEESERCGGIYIMNPDGSNVVNLVDDLCELARITWLPDSSRILYQNYYDIYSINPDGSNLEVFFSLPQYGEPIIYFDLHLPIDTVTPTATDTPTATPTSPPTATDTPTSTPTSTPTATSTPTPTPTATDTPTATPTFTPTATPTSTPTATPTPLSNGLRGAYYNGTHFDTLVTTRTDPVLDFWWEGDDESPAPGVNGDGFSVRWTGEVEAPATGTYTFYTESDDGVRLWVNGKTLVNNWTDHGVTENSGTVSLTAGQRYEIVLEYYESGGGAVLKLSWSGPSIAKQVVPQARLYPTDLSNPSLGQGVTGRYYEGSEFQTYRFSRTDTTVNFDWNDGAPGKSLGYDLGSSYSVRWTGFVQPRYTEMYTFYIKIEDGGRLWVNDLMIIDANANNSPHEFSSLISLEAGRRYTLRFDFRKWGTNGEAALRWSSASQSKQIIPQNRLYFP